MIPPPGLNCQSLTLNFAVEPTAARRLRGLSLLRGMTEGRAQTRPAASGGGFRSHRLLRPDPATRVELLLALEAATPGAAASDLTGRLRLTLLEGSSEAFVALVLRLHAVAFLRLEASCEDPTPIDHGEATEAALAQVLRARLADLLRLLGVAAASGDVEAVHQTRVSLRRLRAALGLFKPILPPSFSAHFNAEARWLGSVLAPVRDWDVYLSESLAPFAARLADDPGLSALQRLAAEARDRAAADMAEALRSPRCLAFQVALDLSIQRRVWRDQAVTEAAARLFAPIGDVAPSLLDRLWRGVRRDGKRLSCGDAEASHDLRKKIKKLRYSLEFTYDLFSRRELKDYLSDLTQMQQRLGAANDAAVARALTAQLLSDRPSPALIRIEGFMAGWRARQSGEAPPDAAEAWRRLKATPKVWRERSRRKITD
ncbi:MAG: CHAD domain-containing protein [Elsteraceae bacterium]